MRVSRNNSLHQHNGRKRRLGRNAAHAARGLMAGCALLAFAGQAARADVITDWNTVALNAIRSAKSSPPVASRSTPFAAPNRRPPSRRARSP